MLLKLMVFKLFCYLYMQNMEGTLKKSNIEI